MLYRSVAIVCCASCGLSAQAVAEDTQTYDDFASFVGVLQDGYFVNPMSGSRVQDSVSFLGNGYRYTATATAGGDPGSQTGREVAMDFGALFTRFAVDAVRFDFEEGDVTAVGGEFFAGDVFAKPLSADVIITLDNGTTTVLNGSGFAGFVSNTPISSITIDANDASYGDFAWAMVDQLVVGTAVPAPAGAAVVGLAFVLGCRRRR